MAGISNSAARAASSGMRQAPSRIEYSEWTWRWTKGASGIAGRSLALRSDGSSGGPGRLAVPRTVHDQLDAARLCAGLRILLTDDPIRRNYDAKGAATDLLIDNS